MMKRWILDAIVGLLSLLLFIAALLVIPALVPGGAAYLIALFIFIGIISAGGYLIRNVSP